MLLKYLLITLLFFIFALLQISFLPYIDMTLAMPNMVFILFSILIFFGRKEEGFFTAAVAGFFSDLFLPSYFGISIISLLAIYFFQRFTNHFFTKDQNEYLIFHFIAIFSVSFIVYHVLLYAFSIIFHVEFHSAWGVIISLIYNLMFATVGFYIYKKFIKKNDQENQLKLL